MSKLKDYYRPTADVKPSDYVWGDMDVESLSGTLGMLLDVLYEKGILTPEEIVDILPIDYVAVVED